MRHLRIYTVLYLLYTSYCMRTTLPGACYKLQQTQFYIYAYHLKLK